LGYDFTPHLPALWYRGEPDAERYRADFEDAIEHRLEETFYQQLHNWCATHGTRLVGHPAKGDEIGRQRFFHIPGQDLVWRWVLPHDPSALEGPESTQAKCSASAQLHLGRTRNSNECFGAYGHGFTWEEMKWLVDWCFVRGVNLLYPHAFYYSVRGPRRDERPPDVGPNSAWWDDYKTFADYCRRMCWLNAESRHVCQLAILGEANRLPWAAAKVCFQHQRDFNYLEARHLWEDAEVSEAGIWIAGMRYRALIVEAGLRVPEQALPALEMLCQAGRVIVWGAREDLVGAARAATPQALVAAIDALCPVDLSVDPPSVDLRVRHVEMEGEDLYVLCNEGAEGVSGEVRVAAEGARSWVDPWRHTEERIDGRVRIELAPYTTMILRVTRR
jgi:hypothetical protein